MSAATPTDLSPLLSLSAIARFFARFHLRFHFSCRFFIDFHADFLLAMQVDFFVFAITPMPRRRRRCRRHDYFRFPPMDASRVDADAPLSRQKLFLSFTPFIFRRQYVSRFSFVFSQLITCLFA
jgi:hypothetical protein